MASSKLLCVLVICVVLGAALPMTEAGLPCPRIRGLVAPCLTYLQKGGQPNPNCCGGIKTLVSSATTTKDRQDACRCLQQSAGMVSGLVPAFAEALPSKCGANIPYKISKSTNCNSVH
ncbi:non-specific lipid-transfer protein 1 isoform X2 [Morus notabilis]|uniref:non-specific lipid-transfer protein 1 isoform X1 n=1 Tax=Morus notabilis TaxID=981085 RepID=UPI000CED1535|nr:non-specific lipid-transfer protein 1 isoform X1 [Morus notabilis]XP_024017879.1 non-specific lipid-transfer protein 1 isoform X2 [Morus notabilis]